MEALARLLFVLPLLAAVPVRAVECSSVSIENLMARESARQDNLKECARSSAKLIAMGGLDGVCAASWRALDSQEAEAAPCMTEAQLAKFAHWRDMRNIYCSELFDSTRGKEGKAFDNHCRTSWDWLKPYDNKRSAETAERWEKELSTVAGLLEHERHRQEDLRECSSYSKAAIEFGAPDGVCSIDWSYLSPAEAKLGPGMSESQLKEFTWLRAQYDESCRKLAKTLGEEAKVSSKCGADWSWLDKAVSALQLKAGRERALGILKQAP